MTVCDLLRHAIRRGAIGSIVAVAFAALPVYAQSGSRIPVPPEGAAAFDRRDYAKAAEAIIPAFESCLTAYPEGDACAELAGGSALLVATAGNAKVERIILRAMDYVDTRVGRDTPLAFNVLSMLARYYDRLLDVNKMLPIAERRLALARKLDGVHGETAIGAAIALCIVQWNLDQGQKAVDLMTPLLAKLPETTPEQLRQAGRAHQCLGSAYRVMDRPREAEGTMRKAIALFERAGGETSENTLNAMADLANILRKLGRQAEALTIAARINGLAAANSPSRALVDWSSPQSADPIGTARAALASAEQKHGAKSVYAVMAAVELGAALIDAGRFDEAASYQARVAAAADDSTLPAAVRIKWLTGLIALTAKQEPGKFEKSLPYMERLIELTKQSGAGTDKLLIDFQMMAGSWLLLSRRPERAYPYLSDAGQLLLRRLASYRDFDVDAQSETRQYSPIFRFKVATAWALTQRR